MNQLKKINFEYIPSCKVDKCTGFEITENELFDKEGGIRQNGPLDLRLGVDSHNDICPVCNRKAGDCLGHQGYINLTLPLVHPGFRNIFKALVKGLCLDCNRYELTKTCGSCGKVKSYQFPVAYIVNQSGSPVPLKRIYDSIGLLPQSDVQQFQKKWKVKPIDLFLTKLIVPSITFRPTIHMGSKTLVDDLSSKLKTIVDLNSKLKKNEYLGLESPVIKEIYNLLSYQLFTYFDNRIANLPVSTVNSGKPVRALYQRIESKEGLLRSSLRGKRTDYATRTVITADANLNIDQVGVPLAMAKTLSIPVNVLKHNIEDVKLWLSNKDYVKALYYQHRLPSGEFMKLKVSEKNLQIILEKLQIGDKVHRQLMTGDPLILTRAPAIHKYSIMGHKIVVYENETNDACTFKLNPTICTPYNADFDGDEMHGFGPQSQSAQIDANLYMAVSKNIRDSKNGFPIVGFNKEVLTGAYLLSKNNPNFNRAESISLLGQDFIQSDKLSYSGRDLISMCLPKDFNFKGDGLVIEEGKLVSGYFVKSNLGRTTQLSRNLLVHLGNQYFHTFHKLMRLFRKHYQASNSSITLFDYFLDDSMQTRINDLKQQYKVKMDNSSEILDLAKDYQVKTYSLLSKYYSQIEDNLAVSMAVSGSSGSLLNLIHMSNVIGQRVVRGLPLKEFFINMYPKDPKSLNQKFYKEGLVWGNYSSGLSFHQFYNDASHARDANITNQLNVTHMGYFSRRVQCSVSDLYIDHNHNVVDARKNLVQFRFGGSGLNSEDYKKDVVQPVLKKKIVSGFFSDGLEQNISISDLGRVAKELSFDQDLARILSYNCGDRTMFSKGQLINMLCYLLTPIGLPIGVATGHAITQPSQQMTLDAKHKLGSQTTLERLTNLVDRSLVPPKVHVTGDKQSLEKVRRLIPKKVKELTQITLDLEQYLIKLSGLNDQQWNILKQILDESGLQFNDQKEVIIPENKTVSQVYNYYNTISNTVISGSTIIKRYLVNDNEIILEGSKGTIQLYRYIDNVLTDSDVNVHYADPIYLFLRRGIESARKLMYLQLCKFLRQGLNIDPRYMSLFCDLMSRTGQLLALSRTGIVMTKSPLTRISFEATKTNIVKLALTRESDSLSSPLSSLIVGKTLPICSNYFKVYL